MKKFSGSAVSRNQVFALSDGSYVVQWTDQRVQELLTGLYRDYNTSDFGHPISDSELRQLKASGRVEHYNRNFVWLFPLPEAGRFGDRKVLGRGSKIRAYYLSTLHPRSQLGQIQSLLAELDLIEQFTARTREQVVVILGKNAVPFRSPQDAERAQTVLEARAPDHFQDITIAFTEASVRSLYRPPMENANDNARLTVDDLIASQTDTSRIAGKRVVLALKQEDEQQAFGELCQDMKLDVKVASTAREALQFLEDEPADLLIADMQLPDMHAFQMLSKVKEIESLRELPIMVITDQPNFTMTVARVDYYVQRPISIARMRHNIYTALSETETVNNTIKPISPGGDPG
jgi:CheY-like chemotaxis protein